MNYCTRLMPWPCYNSLPFKTLRKESYSNSAQQELVPYWWILGFLADENALNIRLGYWVGNHRCWTGLLLRISLEIFLFEEEEDLQILVSDVPFHLLTPELMEYSYLLSQAAKNPLYMSVGTDVLQSLEKCTEVQCGFTPLHSGKANQKRTGFDMQGRETQRGCLTHSMNPVHNRCMWIIKGCITSVLMILGNHQAITSNYACHYDSDERRYSLPLESSYTEQTKPDFDQAVTSPDQGTSHVSKPVKAICVGRGTWLVLVKQQEEGRPAKEHPSRATPSSKLCLASPWQRCQAEAACWRCNAELENDKVRTFQENKALCTGHQWEVFGRLVTDETRQKHVHAHLCMNPHLQLVCASADTCTRDLPPAVCLTPQSAVVSSSSSH
ncbi:hypothetical protein HPG69_005262 [Diceros bicornis minor]|uniref:Uncharacterized protein n=1 Tax=Diceros bicornis minor TaxID=77932 RepID=A0A7J7EGM3_DICBM|nr:hypothetical protein HPG69_005262 [Diceros bicornis minor]